MFLAVLKEVILRRTVSIVSFAKNAIRTTSYCFIWIQLEISLHSIDFGDLDLVDVSVINGL